MKLKYSFLEEPQKDKNQQKMNTPKTFDWDKLLMVLFVILLLLCWLPLPYGYYMFIRWAGLCLFGYLALKEFSEGKSQKAFIYLALAILFQPFIKIALGRMLWNVVDTAVAGWLLFEIFKNNKK